MDKSLWAEAMARLNPLILQPFRYNGLKVTLVDGVAAFHEAGWVSPCHHHPWFEFSFVSCGDFRTTLSGTEFQTGRGQYFLIPPGCRHGHCSMPDAADDGFCLRFLLESLHDESIPAADHQADKMIEILSVPHRMAGRSFRVARIAGRLGADDDTQLTVDILSLLFELTRLWQNETPGAPAVDGRGTRLVSQAMRILSTNYGSDFRMSELSEALGVSYRHLSRIFKQATGVTLVGKLNDIRIAQAKKLLMTTEKTTREIACEVGFENEFYFSRVFTRQAFVAPSAFRSRFRTTGRADRETSIPLFYRTPQTK